MPAVGDVVQAREELVAHGRIGRHRGHHEREPRLAIGVVEARRAAVSSSVGASATSRSARSSARSASSFSASGKPGHLHLVRQTCSSHATVSVVVATLRSASNHAAFWLVVAALSRPARSTASSLRRDRGAIVRGREPPERRAHVVEQLLDVELVGFTRQRRERARRARARAARGPRASPPTARRARRRASADRRIVVQRRRQEIERRAIEIEEPVAEPAADRQHPLRRRAGPSPRARACRRSRA